MYTPLPDVHYATRCTLCYPMYTMLPDVHYASTVCMLPTVAAKGDLFTNSTIAHVGKYRVHCTAAAKGGRHLV